MCRWFTYISNSEPCLLEDVLVDPAHSICKQVHDRYLPGLSHYEPDDNRKDTKVEISTRNSPYNMDGLGAAWYVRPQPPLETTLCIFLFHDRYSDARSEFGECTGARHVVYRILRQGLIDPVFRSICANTSSLTVFSHIRAASGETAITETNCHPFQFGRWLFMHNGVVANFNVIKREMCARMSSEAFDLIKGTTDSEHLAALFFTFLEEKRGAKAWDETHPLEDVKRALEQAITTVIQIQASVVAKTGGQMTASSLNIAVTDGEQLLTIRFRNHATEHPPSLYCSTTAGVTLNRKFPGHPDNEGDNGVQNVKEVHEHGAHVIVASEPTTFKAHEWQLIPKNHCVMVGRDIQVQIVPVDIQF